MTPQQAHAELKRGEVRPLYLVLGPEALLANEVVRHLLDTIDLGRAAAFNEDKLTAGDVEVGTVLAAAQTLPMMSPRRLVMVRAVERWDGNNALDDLATYAKEPSPTTTLVLIASKLNGNRRLVKAAKKEGWIVDCTELKQRELPSWIRSRAETLGHRLERGVDETLAQLVGPDLGSVADALERLSLYVGEGEPIGGAAVAEVVVKVRQETVWAIVDALSARNHGVALRALEDAYEPRDRGLPLLGAVTWQVRKLVKFQGLLGRSGNAKDAAKKAGVPPFKARDVERTVRKLSPFILERWLMLLGEADLALKGSKRDGRAVLATTLVEMCGA